MNRAELVQESLGLFAGVVEDYLVDLLGLPGVGADPLPVILLTNAHIFG